MGNKVEVHLSRPPAILGSNMLKCPREIGFLARIPFLVHNLQNMRGNGAILDKQGLHIFTSQILFLEASEGVCANHK